MTAPGLPAPAGKDAGPANEIVGERAAARMAQGGTTATRSGGPHDRTVIRLARDGSVARPDPDGKDRGEPGQTYTEDASAEPARIDGTTAPPKGPRGVGPGISKVEGDRLTLAVAAGADRPAGFSTSLADSTTVFVHKRADKQKDWGRRIPKCTGPGPRDGLECAQVAGPARPVTTTFGRSGARTADEDVLVLRRPHAAGG